MTTHTVDAIRVAYGVVWHAGGIPEAGRLIIGSDSLRLVEYNRPGKVIAELAFADLSALRLPPAAKGRRVIVLETRQGNWVEIESALDQWILPDVLESAIGHLLTSDSSHQRLLLSIRLRPGTHQRAFDLLPGDQLFSTLPASVRDLFVLGDEVLLLFEAEGDPPTEVEKLWDLIATWHEFIVELGFATHACAFAPPRAPLSSVR